MSSDNLSLAAYNLPSAAIGIKPEQLVALASIMADVSSYYDVFDPVMLDVEQSKVDAAVSCLKAVQNDFPADGKIVLSRGLRADIFSCLTQVWNEHLALSRLGLKAERSDIEKLQQLFYGY